MTDSLLKLTPSFVSRIIRQSRQLKSEAEVLTFYKKLTAKKDTILDENHLDSVLLQNDDQELLLSENIPDILRPFAEALFGAVTTQDNKPEDKAEDPTL